MTYLSSLMTAGVPLLALVACQPAKLASAKEPTRNDRAEQLRGVDARVFALDGDRAAELARTLDHNVSARIQAANRRENAAWERVKTRTDWEKYRADRLHALQESLGQPPAPQENPKLLVTRTLTGDGYRTENLVFESRPGLVVTANLYSPAKPTQKMPGILIAHSHHNPKTQGELQDMGMTWARQGCLVLVIDQLGHGERRQHPFRTQADYPRPFRAERQDYYFRFNSGVQLQMIGESLMGWMVRDLMRGLSVLLEQPGIDKERIILLGSVAGGGDPAAVTAALDQRVSAVVPFNFGGPQPDYALPADPERDFYYFGVADWESTRCLRLGARDGFSQWLIVASVAPRHLIYAHEFAWEAERDPVWPRIQKVFSWYDAADHLAVAHGRGKLRGTPPESSHCNNIGPLHRSQIYPALKQWFDMPIPDEFSQRRPSEELLCLTPAAIQEFRPRTLHELAAELGANRAIAARQKLASLSPSERRQQLRQAWARLLGDVEPKADPKVVSHKTEPAASASIERIALEVERDVVVPLVLLLPATKPATRLPIVIGLAQEGKQAFLQKKSKPIADLLDGGAAVCLVDARGTGETRPGDGARRHNGTMTRISATNWLLGETLVGSQLRDVRSVLHYLRGRAELDAKRVVLWGDSFAAPNPPDRNLAVPLDADPFPTQAEPLGGLLALFGALFDDGVRAVSVRGCLTGFDSLLESPFCYVPHDALIPGALLAGDLCDVAAALAPRALRMEQMVDGLNRTVPPAALARIFEPARAEYRALKSESSLQLEGGEEDKSTAAEWLLRQLRAE